MLQLPKMVTPPPIRKDFMAVKIKDKADFNLNSTRKSATHIWTCSLVNMQFLNRRISSLVSPSMLQIIPLIFLVILNHALTTVATLAMDTKYDIT